MRAFKADPFSFPLPLANRTVGASVRGRPILAASWGAHGGTPPTVTWGRLLAVEEVFTNGCKDIDQDHFFIHQRGPVPAIRREVQYIAS